MSGCDAPSCQFCDICFSITGPTRTLVGVPRPLRPQFAGAVYHITVRGNRGQPIFATDADREWFIELLGLTVRRYDWTCHAYCLMGNHTHLVIETPQPNISAGMQYLCGRYGQSFNWRNGYDGHLFQGRFHSVVVESTAQLLVLVRYVAMNPVRAGLCARPQDWTWSSYRVLLGSGRRPSFLRADFILSCFSPRTDIARALLAEFVFDAPPRAGP